MTSGPPAMMNVFSAVCPRPAPSRSLAGPVTCEAALPSSSCHLWAAARWGSVSQLSLLPARSLKPAAGCYSQGETAWTEIKWNLILWLCANLSTEQLFILLPASMSCSQVSRQRDVVVGVQFITGHVTHNYVTISLNVCITEGDGCGVRNSRNKKTFSLFLCAGFFFVVLTALCPLQPGFSWTPWLSAFCLTP